MNTQDLATAGTELVHSLINILNKGVEDIPPYVQNLVMRYGNYIGYKSLINSIFGLIVLGVGIIIIRRGRKLIREDDENPGGYLAFILGLVLIFVSLTIISQRIGLMIKGFMIPDILLLEQMRVLYPMY